MKSCIYLVKIFNYHLLYKKKTKIGENAKMKQNKPPNHFICIHTHQVNYFLFFKFFFKDFIYLFLERREGREKERERNTNVWLPLMCPPLGTWPATQACALAGNQTGDPLLHRPVLSPLTIPASTELSIF